MLVILWDFQCFHKYFNNWSSVIRVCIKADWNYSTIRRDQLYNYSVLRRDHHYMRLLREVYFLWCQFPSWSDCWLRVHLYSLSSSSWSKAGKVEKAEEKTVAYQSFFSLWALSVALTFDLTCRQKQCRGEQVRAIGGRKKEGGRTSLVRAKERYFIWRQRAKPGALLWLAIIYQS